MTATSANPEQTKYRKLQIAFSAMCGILCLLLVAWWARSYTRIDNINFDLPGRWVVQLFTTKGSFAASIFQCDLTWFWHSPKEWPYDTEYPGPRQFQVYHVKGCSTLRVPYWSLVLISSTTVIAPWLPWRFSLRTLLIATTLIGLVLGTIIATTR